MSLFSLDNLIFRLPAFDLNNYFTDEVLTFIFIIAAFILGILLCFVGHRFLFTFTLIGLGIGAGFIAIRIISSLLKDPILRMFFFVTFIFLMECLLYGIASLLGLAAKKLHIRKATTTLLVIISSLLGFACLFADLYMYVYRGVIEVLVFSLVIAIAGFIHQQRKKLMKREFFTYDDIYYDNGR